MESDTRVVGGGKATPKAEAKVPRMPGTSTFARTLAPSVLRAVGIHTPVFLWQAPPKPALEEAPKPPVGTPVKTAVVVVAQPQLLERESLAEVSSRSKSSHQAIRRADSRAGVASRAWHICRF